eukprot:856282-Amphidinium_carterae.1
MVTSISMGRHNASNITPSSTNLGSDVTGKQCERLTVRPCDSEGHRTTRPEDCWINVTLLNPRAAKQHKQST